MFENPVFCAIDTPDIDRAADVSAAIAPYVGGLKVGMEYFYACGEAGYRAVAAAGKPVFLDLKLHDIPNTVASAIRALAPLQPAIVNVHAGGGRAMMQAAAAAARDSGASMRVIGVSVLTSLDEADLAELGLSGTVRDHVRRLGALARECGLDGMVCSAHEIEILKAECGADFLLVVPGIRPAGAAKGDQKRIMTPAEALALGADILVIGRPITAADDPAAAAAAIAAEIGNLRRG
ncbi:MAG: orotidine-5'-phosphate decarboxylase [Hyphomicrobiales bacterium]|nr:MAG: orotidine-5'-phosphate decarboxylase [Hyphomicrobiales bacterium]